MFVHQNKWTLKDAREPTAVQVREAETNSAIPEQLKVNYPHPVHSGVPRGCLNPPPRNSEGPTKNHAKLNPIVKTVKKTAEFRMPTHQDVRKKGSKILKLCRFAFVLH